MHKSTKLSGLDGDCNNQEVQFLIGSASGRVTSTLVDLDKVNLLY
jgi:hypothetical protein